MAIEFTKSAGRHGFTEADAVHAMSNVRYYEPEFDESRDDQSAMRAREKFLARLETELDTEEDTP